MEWSVFTISGLVPQYVAIVGMLVLALAVLRLGFLKPAHRAFALLLVLRAISMFAATMREVHTHLTDHASLSDATFWANVFPWFVIPIPFVIIRLASVYPRRRTFFGRHRAGLPVLILTAIAAEIVYLVDHGAWTSLGTNAAGAPAYWSTGPLALFLGLTTFGLACLGLVFAADFARLPKGPRKYALLVVALGFIVNGLYEGTGALLILGRGQIAYLSVAVQWLTVASLAPTLAALGLIVHHALTTEEPAVRQATRQALLVTPLPVLSVLPAVYWNTWFGGPPPVMVFAVLNGIWRLTFPALVTYALVKFQLFDIDLKIKSTIKQSTLGIIGFGAFTLSSELIENQITPSFGDGLGLAIAVALAFTLTPVQRFAQRVADRVMPHTRDTPEYLSAKRVDVFRATLEGAYEDGAITERERRLLQRLRTQLGLEEATAELLEREVMASHIDRTAHSAMPA